MLVDGVTRLVQHCSIHLAVRGAAVGVTVEGTVHARLGFHGKVMVRRQPFAGFADGPPKSSSHLWVRDCLAMLRVDLGPNLFCRNHFLAGRLTQVQSRGSEPSLMDLVLFLFPPNAVMDPSVTEMCVREHFAT